MISSRDKRIHLFPCIVSHCRVSKPCHVIFCKCHIFLQLLLKTIVRTIVQQCRAVLKRYLRFYHQDILICRAFLMQDLFYFQRKCNAGPKMIVHFTEPTCLHNIHIGFFLFFFLVLSDYLPKYALLCVKNFRII